MRKLMFGRHAVLFYFVAALLAMTVAAQADTFTMNNSGTGTTTDTNYLVALLTGFAAAPPQLTNGSNNGGTLGGAAAPADIITSGIPVAWLTGAPLGGARWIGPPAFGNNASTATANSYWDYQVSFNAVGGIGIDPSTILITGSIASDNCPYALGVNGGGVSPAPTGAPGLWTSNCLGQANTFAIGGINSGVAGTSATYKATATFVAGTNTLQFEVFNDSSAPPNPTGLVVFNLAGTGNENQTSTPEPSTAGLVIAGIGAAAWLRRRSFRRSA